MTTTIRMVSLQPNLVHLYMWATAQGLVTDHNADMGYILHAAMTAAFGPHAPKPFRWIERRQCVELYGYTQATGEMMASYARTYAEPKVLNALGGLESLSIKDMPVSWNVGQRLGFEVRFCPTVRQDRNGDRSKSCERDAFLVACERTNGDTPVERSTVYGDWLSNRLTPAAKVNMDPHSALRLVSFQLTHLQRQGHVKSNSTQRIFKKIYSPDALIAGELVISDADAFSEMLSRGIGRHRAFGFGMLLLRPLR